MAILGARNLLRAAALVAVLPLAACAHQPPAELASQFTPPSGNWLTNVPAGSVCFIRLDDITDSRIDAHEMGTIGPRAIHSADTIAWLRSGIAALTRDPRLKFADASAPAGDVVLFGVELIKAYMMSQNTSKSTDVVVRVRYTKGGTTTEQVYRGETMGPNWMSGEDETQIAFDGALADLLTKMDTDLVARCRG